MSEADPATQAARQMLSTDGVLRAVIAWKDGGPEDALVAVLARHLRDYAEAQQPDAGSVEVVAQALQLEAPLLDDATTDKLARAAIAAMPPAALADVPAGEREAVINALKPLADIAVAMDAPTPWADGHSSLHERYEDGRRVSLTLDNARFAREVLGRLGAAGGEG